ncbi:MAG TPA: glycosyltransferase family 4 protein [Bacteroidales bacterium]|nr:glycosyltransferase family 4 protein [Bacteroidales bacterium]
MKILLINHYAGSPGYGMEYRPYYFAKIWQTQGHSVTIIGSSFSHVRTKQPYIDTSKKEEIIDRIRYIWIKTPRYSGNGKKRILNIIVFIFKIFLNARFLSEYSMNGAVIASSTYPLDIFPAKRISKISNAALIFEVHDLWPLSPMELGGYSKYNPFIQVIQMAEDFAYRKCDQLVSMLPETLDYMVKHGLNPDKFNYIPNGINLDEWKNEKELPQEIAKLIEYLIINENTLIAYTGTHGLANALESLIDAAAMMQNMKVAFILVGSGPEKEQLKKKALTLNLGNVYFLNPILKEFIPVFLSKMDILYIGLQKQSLFKYGISPNKLIDYLMAGKPVIQAIEAGNDIVSDSNCGISIEAENPIKIREAILKLLSFSKDELKELGKNGHDYVLKNHEYSILANKFLKVLELSCKIQEKDNI